MISESFGRMLRRKRKEAGLSQRDLGQLVDLDFTYLSKIENDKLPAPSFKAIRRLAIALCSDIEEMASFAEISKQYMARLDAHMEEIGRLNQVVNSDGIEIAQLRNALVVLFNASDTYASFVEAERHGCLIGTNSNADRYHEVAHILRKAWDRACEALDSWPPDDECQLSDRDEFQGAGEHNNGR